jgi:IBR domain.
MKKLLLLSLLSFTQISKPISARQVIGGLTMIGGAGGTAYSQYKNYDLNKKITAIRAQLRNTQANSPERAKLIAELNSLITLTHKNNIISLGSLTLCGIGRNIMMLPTPAIHDPMQGQLHNNNLNLHQAPAQRQEQPRNLTDQELRIQRWQQNQPIRNAATQQRLITRQENLTRRVNQRAAQQGPQRECAICAGSTAVENYIALTCGHNHCPDCLEHMITNALQERTTAVLRCPELNCRQAISPDDIAQITANDQDIIDAITRIRHREQIVTQPNFRECPTPNCTHHFTSNTNNVHTMTCPECNVRYCSDCLHEHPNTITCQQIRQNNRANNEWIEQNTQPCPQCHTPIERTEGCLHMICRNCRYQFCWNCLQAAHCHGGCTRPTVNQHLQNENFLLHFLDGFLPFP